MKKKKLVIQSVIGRSAADMFLPLACTFGCYVVLHGHLSPGGGFQGGVLLASAILLVFLGYGSQHVKSTFNHRRLHNTETMAEILYVVIALIGVFTGLNFCVNFVFNGQKFDTSVLMNHAVGYHVMGGIICLLAMMLSQLESDDDDEVEKTDEKEDEGV